MATKDELHTLAMSLFDNAKDDLARDGWVMNTPQDYTLCNTLCNTHLLV